jgi:hypothetical protein
VARSKSQLLSPTPLMPSQPSFCTFSITSFLRDIAFAFLVKCQPFVHDATASGLLGPAHGPAAVLRTVRPRPLGISGRREAQAGSHGTRSTFRGDGQGRGLEPDCQSESESQSRSRTPGVGGNSSRLVRRAEPPPPLLPAGTPSFSERVCSLPPSRLPSVIKTLSPPPPAAPSFSDRLCSLAVPRRTFL